jgi:hypothetical protein
MKLYSTKDLRKIEKIALVATLLVLGLSAVLILLSYQNA